MLDRGRAADGTCVICERQLDALFARTRTNPAYGRLWWLNGGSETVGVGVASPRRAGQNVVAALPDTVAAMGALDRKLFVVPRRKLVVVRSGMAAPDREIDERLWTLLNEAMPRR